MFKRFQFIMLLLTATVMLIACGNSTNGDNGVLPNIASEYVVTRSSSSFFITPNGELYAWGSNEAGHLGLGNLENQMLPKKVTFQDGSPLKLSSMDNLFFNNFSVLVRVDNGSLFAWGRNDNGQLGVGSTDNVTKPTPVLFEDGSPLKLSSMDNLLKDFTIGQYSVFARLDNGSLFAWGNNSYGQLGIGSTDNAIKPTPVLLDDGSPLNISSMDNILKDSTIGQFSVYARLDNGSLFAWGYNNDGQLGVGNWVNQPKPTQVLLLDNSPLTLSSMDNLVVNRSTVFAYLDNGSLFSWGNNGDGQLGIGNKFKRSKPTQVVLEDNSPLKLSSMDNFYFSAISAFVRLDNGNILAWGWNTDGQLGVGNVDVITKATPVLFKDGSPLKLSSMDNFYLFGSSAYARLDNDSLIAWGSNYVGILGLGDVDKVTNPTPVLFKDGSQLKLSSMDNFKAYGSSAYARLDNGSLFAWGWNEGGGLGVGIINLDNITSPTPVLFEDGSPLKLSSMDNLLNYYYSLAPFAYARLDNGSLFAWGSNGDGQLGIGSTDNAIKPTPVLLEDGSLLKLSSIDNLFAYYYSAFAYLDNGSLFTWGFNDRGQLGVGDTENKNKPVRLVIE